MWLRNHRRSWLAPIAFLSMSASGVLVVLGKRIVDYPSNLWGAASYPVSALAAAAFLCALVTHLQRRRVTDAEHSHLSQALNPLLTTKTRLTDFGRRA
jgi:hypothetical protein